MSAQFKKGSLEGLKYVIVEVKSKTNDSAVSIGAFIGIRPLIESNTALLDKSDEFIWLSENERVYMLNLDLHDINTIYVGKYSKAENKVAQMTLYGKDTSYCIKILKSIVEIMEKEDRISSAGLIDTDTYSDIPDKLKKKLKIGQNSNSESPPNTNRSIADDTRTFHNNRSGASNYSSGSNAFGYAGYSKVSSSKVVSTSTFKRTTKYPIKQAQMAIQVKIDAIKKGTYTAPKLKEIPVDSNQK